VVEEIFKFERGMTNQKYPIVTIHNESAFIQQELGAILAQDYPADRIKVILADGMSTDDTRQPI